MILQALSRYYQQLIERPVESVAPFGYSPEKISFEILLALDGSVVRVNDLRDTPGKAPRPRLLYVPQAKNGPSALNPTSCGTRRATCLA